MPPRILRLPNSAATSTQIHANIGADPAVWRHRRSIELSPRDGRMSRLRRYADTRAEPRSCSPAISPSGTSRSVRTSRRRTKMPGNRGTRPTIARSDAHASRGLPENSPTTISERVTKNSWMASKGSRRAPLRVAMERIRWRACSSAGRRSGRRSGNASRCRARAMGTTTTLAPPRWARQQRSTSSP